MIYLFCFFFTAEPPCVAPSSNNNNVNNNYCNQSKNVKLPSYKDYLALSNYNTAPRGWKQGDSIYYRPVTFNGQSNRDDTRRKSFTDF